MIQHQNGRETFINESNNAAFQIEALAGKLALVTGASSGIGQFIARGLDDAGARVIVQYHKNKAGAEALTASLKHEARSMQADLRNESDIRRLFTSLAAGEKADILINCAAEQTLIELNAMTMAEWQSMQSTNVDAVFLLSQLFAAQDNGGVIVNISSIEGSRPAVGHAHYSTSKAALEMLTKACAMEFGPSGIRVNAVAPGLIWREGIESGWPEGVNSWISAAPLGRLGQPGEIANAVVFLASDAACFITGAVLTVDGGMLVQPGW